MRIKNKVLLAPFVLIALALGGFAAYAWHPAFDPVSPPSLDSFAAAAVRRGAELAAIGNCNVCHTAPGGRIFAGGLGIATPFGTIYSSNITPDPDTGIGRWSEAAFTRSMRAGLDREGRHLYPAFPYDHYTLVSDADTRALYAYLMTREPVRSVPPPNALPFPLNQRWVLAGWKLLFFREGRYRSDAARDAEWNRGAYLAEGLGHCGACHTPRNAFGAERETMHFAGGEAEGWHAYALGATSPAAIPWDVPAMASYLRQGWQQQHGIARGPMAPVVGNLATIAETDVQALARYVVTGMGEASPERQRRATTALQLATINGAAISPTSGDSQAAESARGSQGAAIYHAACATCHEAGRPLPFGGMPLSLSTGITGPSPGNLLNVVLNGLPAATGERAPIMPGFRNTLDDAQLVALANYLRGQLSNRPAWTEIEEAVRQARARDGQGASRPLVATRSAPSDPSRQ